MSDPPAASARSDVHAEIRRNQWHAAVLLLAVAVPVLVVGAVVVLAAGLGAGGLVAAVLLAGAASLVAYLAAPARALAAVHARPAAPDDYSRFHNLVEGICIAAGLPKPDLYVIDDPAPNAFTTGRSPRHAALAVTTGLLDQLNRVELEGVLAHELSHVKNDDVVAATVAVTTAGPWTAVSPVAAELVHFAVGTRRETRADASSVFITRYPPGLSAALAKIAADPAVVRHTRRSVAPLWLASPLAPDRSRLDRAFETHPSLAERIRLLNAL